MASAAGSLFARTYAGHTGVDPYTTAVSDVYQDLFDEGIFTGKGLYDVDAFAAALEGRVPENALLSHDLFEGLYARTALVTDVEVVDDYPSSVLAHARRQHRWVRGDWQILWWLFPFVPSRTGLQRNRLPLISRWKILDNLRRSLMAPATVALLLLGWTVLPGIAGRLDGDRRSPPLALPVVPAAARSCSAGRRGWSRDARSCEPPSRICDTDVVRVVAAAGVPRQSGLRDGARDHRDARAPRRSRKHRLLEWETAAASADRGGPPRLRVFVEGDDREPADRGRRPRPRRPGPSARAARGGAGPRAVGGGAADRVRAQPAGADPPRGARPGGPRVPRSRWRSRRGGTSRRSSAPEDHALPPDNVQLVPELTVAHRTSPTNIGMALLATLAAHDLGFIDTDELADRIDATLTTVESLERFEGHLLNWYDTRTLAPLPPAYVSTVDSGNLAGALLDAVGGVAAAVGGTDDAAARRAARRSGRRAAALFDGMNFRFLYDPQRQLFTIGYRLADAEGPGRRDPSYYDLLASEARLASFLAIAKGDVPESHWFHLGRP